MPSNRLYGFNEPVESPGGPPVAVATDVYAGPCPGCGQMFPKTRDNKEHCSDKCRTRAWDKKHPRVGVRRNNGQQLQLAIEARDKGVAKVKVKNADFVETLRSVARMIAREKGTVCADDLRKWADENEMIPTSHNAWGAIFCRNQDFVLHGYARSQQIQGHGNLQRIWKLKLNVHKTAKQKDIAIRTLEHEVRAMTFDEWEETQGYPSGFECIGRERMRQVWDAAQADERESCAKLVEIIAVVGPLDGLCPDGGAE